MHQVILILIVAVAYLALSGLSAVLALFHADAWTVWLAIGLTLGISSGTMASRN